MYEVNLGRTARDKITGFEGVITIVTSYIYGVDRAELQPPKVNDDGKIPDSYSFDITCLEIIKEKNRVIEPTFEETIKHGQVVKDHITDFQGTVVAVGYHINGCRRIGVQRNIKDNKDHKLEDVSWFDEHQLSVVNEKTIERKNDTGGPNKYSDIRRY